MYLLVCFLMAKLYQSGDDVWRVFNYETELSKLKAMATKAQVKGNPFTMRASTLEQMKIAQARFGDNYNRESIDISKLSRNDRHWFVIGGFAIGVGVTAGIVAAINSASK